MEWLEVQTDNDIYDAIVKGVENIMNLGVVWNVFSSSPRFQRIIKDLGIDIQYAEYEPAMLKNRDELKINLLQKLEEGAYPIIKRCCYTNS